jgi:glycosyltransferase involved in cell wall biosynthesis
LRILLASANFAPHVGGIERFAESLAGGLAARGHEVTVVCCRADGAPAREHGAYEVVRIPSTYVLERRLRVPYPLPSPVVVRTLARLLQNAEVVHVQDAVYATSVAALIAARRRGVPSVLTQHVGFVPQTNRVLDAIEHGALATIARGARLATVVTTVNPAVAAWAARTWRIPEPLVLPVGVAPPAGAASDRGLVRRSFGLPEDRFLALFVGRDVSKKGLDVFLGARDPAYELVAVTDRSGHATGGTLLPFMASDRLGELLHAVDAFVLPSEGEGFPLTLQEAFAAGLPVVTTMQPGYERYLDPSDVLVIDREAGSLRAALRRLAGNPELREALAERSLVVAEDHFGLERFVSAYVELYAEAINRPA